MPTILPQGLSFDDVLLVPRLGSGKSRFNGDIDLSTQITPHLRIKYPIISSNMDTVTSGNMAAKMEDLGALGIPHRFMSPKEHLEELKKIPAGGRVACIGIGKNGLARLETLADIYLEAILIDIAHGHCTAMIEQIQEVKRNQEGIPIIAGNVATYEGAMDLFEAGADVVKVGVGCGSLCTTRIQTGCGYPQLSAIIETKRATENFRQRTIIADGGIRNGGDIVKALAAGADAVMTGSLFTGTTEAPGEPFRLDGFLYKNYRGMASKAAQESWKGTPTSIEGEIKRVPFQGPVQPIFNDVINNVMSGMSYQGASTLEDLRTNAVFVQQSSAGYIESGPHGLLRNGG